MPGATSWGRAEWESAALAHETASVIDSNVPTIVSVPDRLASGAKARDAVLLAELAMRMTGHP
jgi:hypothetical protein